MVSYQCHTNGWNTVLQYELQAVFTHRQHIVYNLSQWDTFNNNNNNNNNNNTVLTSYKYYLPLWNFPYCTLDFTYLWCTSH